MDAADLYGLPVDEFIAARAALVKELKAAGDKDAAAEVGKLRKPSVAAAAVNALVRSADVAALWKAGDALSEVQGELLAGKADGRALRAARAAEQEALAGVLAQLPADTGGAIRERVSETLHAAALDESAREQVAAGRLERELQHAGLGLDGMEAFAAAAPPRPRKRAARPADDTAEREAAARAEAEAQAAARKAAEAERATATKVAARAEKALTRAQAKRDQAAAALAAADAELDAARDEAQAAAAALDALS